MEKSFTQIRINRRDVIFFALLLLTVVYIIRKSTSDYYNYLALGGVLLSTLFILLRRPGAYRSDYFGVCARILLFFLVMLGLSFALSRNLLLDIKYLGVLGTCFFPVIFYGYAETDLSDDIKRLITYGGLFIWIYYCVKAAAFYLTHSGAARYLAQDPGFYGDIAIGGGYFLAYGSAVLGVYFFERICHKHISLLSLAVLFLCTAVVLMTESFITILGMLAGYALIICGRILHFFNISKTRFAIMCIILIAVFYFTGLWRWTLEEIYRIFVPIQAPYAWRIVEIVNMLLGKGIVEEGAISLRWIVYEQSVSTFLKHPVLGQIFGGNLFTGSGTGGHSEVLDALAQWGLVVGGAYLALYWRSVKFIWNTVRHKTFLAVFALLMILNPVRSFHIMFVTFLVIPLYEKGSAVAETSAANAEGNL